MAVGEGMVPVIEVGAVPMDVVIVEREVIEDIIDCGRLAAALGRAGWNSELFSASSQCGLVARFNLRR